MDQIKIGKFIAERRKAVNITQLQLVEKLGITDKAVSKWERGIAMPDSSIMLTLCEILQITVNELLSGEKCEENDKEKNQRLLIKMTVEMENAKKQIWICMRIILIVSMIALFVGTFLCVFFIPEGLWQILAIVGIIIVFLIPCFYSLKLEISIGTYKCKNCGHEIVPTYTQAFFSMHVGTTRYFKCPHCGKRTWCKKVLK